MINTLLGQKLGMTQEFIDESRVPVTKIKLGPCIVTQIKTEKKDGYNAYQLGYGVRKIKNVTKPLQGHLKGAITDKKAPYFLREVKVKELSEVKPGDTVNIADIFQAGDVVRITGKSKGKGFSGVVKRWGFAGAPASHGHGGELRRAGSIGQGTTPGVVRKGKKMAGRMGYFTKTITGVKVLGVDHENGILSVKGSIPGPNGTYLIVRQIKQGPKKDVVTKENENAKD